MNNKVLTKCGFLKDENGSQLTEVFQDGIKFKEIYIDIYPVNPLDNLCPVLLLRNSDENVVVENDGRYLTIKKNDKYKNCIMNILFDGINDIYFKKISEGNFEFILNYQNIFYKTMICK